VGTESSGYVSDLRLAGYAVLPEPREVVLAGGAVEFGSMDWGLSLADVADDDIAVRTLRERLRDEYNFGFEADDEIALGEVTVAVRPGAVETGTGDGRDEQAYVIEVAPENVTLTANGLPGLYYAVQTLLQLLDNRDGTLPLGRIADWPRFELRLAHWDTKHHRDTLETLRRYLDWCGRFKINGILFELEDKFEYPSHPVIGNPGAFTTEELQGLVDYALERHIQIVPDVQSPAHMSYMLKHEEFAHLRCDDSNYQSCMDEAEVRKLIFEMYDDVCAATKGVKYFHVSTDEIYYAGICEKFRKPYNPENRSLTVVDYVNAAHKHITEKWGKQVIIWLEYPILPEHIELLPPDLLNGIGMRQKQVPQENARGIRQFTYCPIQGGEITWPSYFAQSSPARGRMPGKLADALAATRESQAATGNPIGTICAAWDDCGLHGESFWLGWAAMAQCSWTQDNVNAHQIASVFMDVYYGSDVDDMVEVYRDMQSQARFMEYTLEKLPSKARGPSYGHPYWKGLMERTDRTLMPAATPRMPNDTAVNVLPEFGQRYSDALAEIPARIAESDRLLARLYGNLPRARRNRYNIEVLISLAHYLRHFLEMMQGVAEAEKQMHQASIAGKGGDDSRAMHCMVAAREKMQWVVDDLYDMFERLTAVWEKSRLPKNAPMNGKEYVHVMDDVKDHFADRRVGLDYLIAPEEALELKQWIAQVDEVIERYGEATGLGAKKKDDVPV
jgi:hexosaminidase